MTDLATFPIKLAICIANESAIFVDPATHKNSVMSGINERISIDCPICANCEEKHVEFMEKQNYRSMDVTLEATAVCGKGQQRNRSCVKVRSPTEEFKSRLKRNFSQEYPNEFPAKPHDMPETTADAW